MPSISASTPPAAPRRSDDAALAKTPTGISGLDEVTRGGIPAGRPTLVCGGPGCGKTVLAMEFLARGADHSQDARELVMSSHGVSLGPPAADIDWQQRPPVMDGRT